MLTVEECVGMFEIAYAMNKRRINGDFWARVILITLLEEALTFPTETIVFHENWEIQRQNGSVGISSLNSQEVNSETVRYILRIPEIKRAGIRHQARGNVALFSRGGRN